jgi:predicted RNA binding protein YcfA (HicA-like mRNA interferase family)
MDKLPRISGREMARILTRMGFTLKSQKGSHMKFVRQHDIRKEIVIVPNHKMLRKGTLNDILKKIDIHSVDELKKLMK